MANYTATTDMTLETAISNGSMVDGENLTINAGAIVTCDQTPSILIGAVTTNEGKYFIDGENISAGNMINHVGEYQQAIAVNGQGIFEVRGAWYSLGTTDGSNSQVFALATYYDSSFCVDIVPMIQVETGRRIDFDNASGTTPVVDDFVYKSTDRSVMGRIVEVNIGSSYIVVKYLTGTLADDDEIQIRKVVNNEGPDLQQTWTADVDNGSGDILESGIYQEFGNSRGDGNSYIASFHAGVGGFVFDNAFQSTTLTMGSAVGGGFVPPTGCDVRIPNVHFSTSNIANYGSNNTYHDGTDTEGNWYNLVTISAGEVDFSICNMGSAYFGTASASSFVAEYVGAAIEMGSFICASRATFNHCVVVSDGMGQAAADGYSFRAGNLVSGADIVDCMAIAPETDHKYIGGLTSFDLVITGCIVSSPCAGVFYTFGVHLYRFDGVDGIVFNNNIGIGADNSEFDSVINMTNTSNFESNMFLMSCTQDETAQTNSKDAIVISEFCDEILFKGIEFIGDGVPGDDIFYIEDSSNIKVRGIGMIDDKVDLGSTGGKTFSITGFCSNVDFARCWREGGSDPDFSSIPITARGTRITNCSAEYASRFYSSGADDTLLQGLHAGSGDIGSSTGVQYNLLASYGRQIHDGFRSDTVGYIVCVMNDPSVLINNITITAGDPKFFKNGRLTMVSGDVLEIEQDYFAKGHAGFSGGYTAAVYGAAWGDNNWGNITVDFQYDLGSGWNGSWLDARTAGNWTGISITASIGVKLKYRFTATGTQTPMTAFAAHTTTTISGQKSNFYPIDQVEVTHTLIGLQEDTEITYTQLPAASDSGSDGSTTANSRNFLTTNTWATNEWRGHLCIIESGVDAGRYYVVSNTTTTLVLDSEMSATAGTLDYSIYDETLSTELHHVENVSALGISEYVYTYVSDFIVDILIHHQDYVSISILEVTMGDTDQTIPVAQVPDGNYYNPV